MMVLIGSKDGMEFCKPMVTAASLALFSGELVGPQPRPWFSSVAYIGVDSALLSRAA